MKRNIFLFFAALNFVAAIYAQNSSDTNLSPYVFPLFEDGIIKFKNGQESKEKLNYNGVTEEMIYISLGEKLAVDNLSEIEKIIINGRIFIPFDEKFYEKVGTAVSGPFIRYKFRLEGPEKPSAYGGSSQTTASTNYSGLTDYKMFYELSLPVDYKVIKNSSFFFKSESEFKEVSNRRQAIKLFDAFADEIKKFVKENNIDFSNEEDMIKLGEFFDSLH